MTQELNSREELIKELCDKLSVNRFKILDIQGIEFIANFIMQDRKRVIEPLVESIKDLVDTLSLHRGDTEGCYTMINTGEMEQSIERAMETLKNAGIETDK